MTAFLHHLKQFILLLGRLVPLLKLLGLAVLLWIPRGMGQLDTWGSHGFLQVLEGLFCYMCQPLLEDCAGGNLLT